MPRYKIVVFAIVGDIDGKLAPAKFGRSKILTHWQIKYMGGIQDFFECFSVNNPIIDSIA